MVPIPESSYFPPLDKCLNGDKLLISWKTAFYAILNEKTSKYEDESPIHAFFSDATVQNLLSHPSRAFSKPTPETKTAFETKTSAINVTPSTSARFDIKVVKDDALWLAKEAKIDEISALRIVVEECQSRTSAQLLGRFSNQELAAIQEAAGHSQSSVPVALLSQGTDAEIIQKEFNTQESCRFRILQTYLSERQFLLKCVNYLLQIYGGVDPSDSGNENSIEDSSSAIREFGATLAEVSGANDVVFLECIDAIKENIKNVSDGSGWTKEEGWSTDNDLDWTNSQITEATSTLEVIFQIIERQETLASTRRILTWLELVSDYNFFQFNTDDPSTKALVLHMQSITAVISLSILSVGPCVGHLQTIEAVPLMKGDDNIPWLLNSDAIENIHNLFVKIAEQLTVIAGPAVLGWCVIIQTMRYRVQQYNQTQQDIAYSGRSSSNNQTGLPPDVYQDTVDAILGDGEEDPIQYLAASAVDGTHVFDTLSDLALRFGNTSNGHFSNMLGARMRIVMLDLIQSSSGIVGYIPEVVAAALSCLSGAQSYWDFADAPKFRDGGDPNAAFLQSEEMMTNLLMVARARYPYESLPFLQLVRSLATCASGNDQGSIQTVSDFLEQMPRFTFLLPDRFSGYETTQEEENNNSIRLTQPIELFEPRVRQLPGTPVRSSALLKADPDFCIPAGTYGRMVSDSEPKIACWFHEFSGLKYFGKLLETFLGAGDQIDATTGDIADRDSVTEIIALFATLLLSISKTAINYREEALRILEVASSGLSRNRDITSVVFDIFEEELQKQSTNFGSEVPLDLLSNCIQFMHALTSVTPGRVWPLVGRSGLLDLGRGGGKLASIVGSVELVSGRYSLLLSCTRLYEALVEDFVTNAVSRRSRGKSSARFGNVKATGTGISDQVLSKVLLSFTRYLVDVLESSCFWKFVDPDDSRRLRKNITGTFDKILCYTFSIENTVSENLDSKPPTVIFQSQTFVSKTLDPNVPPPGLMGPLESAASYIIESFLSTSSGTLRVQPLLHAYYDGFGTSDFTPYFHESQLCVAQVSTVLAFSKTLLQVSSLLERPSSQLETQLFQASPLIARLYCVNDSYKITVVALFEALVHSAASNAAEPPSLLGHLGPQTSKNFLHILSDLDKPLSRGDHFIATMQFLSKVVSCRQQWFANYLLTGRTSKDALKNKAGGRELATLDKPPLNTALDSSLKISDIAPVETVRTLEFIALAQNFWPWATYDSQKHAEFVTRISEFVGAMKPLQPSTTLDGALNSCYQTKIAAYIAEILAMHLFHARQTGTSAITKGLTDNLSYFVRFAVAVPNYNASLHANLKRNFETQYPGCKLLDFKRSNLEDHQLGSDYFYDLDLADKMLAFDAAWGRKDGFQAEVVNANVNLSLVDAQISLLHGWKFLAIELSTNISGQVDLQSTLARVASDCMNANRRSQGSEEVFTRLNQTRADLALVLIQRLIEVKSTVAEMQGLLTIIWETIRQSNITFDEALNLGDPTYYRSLLKLLFLGLRVHSEAKTPAQLQANLKASTRLTQSTSIIPTIIDILDRVVARGLRHLTVFIHDKPVESSPEDLALITGILQACLRIPGIEFCYSQIVSMFVSNDSVRTATTLFSWSDTLAINGDPIYGELSALFLVELSTVPAMAEQLAVEGVLGHIAAANITSYLRRGNVSPFADGAGLQRCYNIWVRGILPLLLNLLDSVGASIAIEVSLFLNQFPSLIKQSTEAFDAPETSRTATKSQKKYISLSMCSEVHTLSLILFILNGFRETAPGTEIPEVKWDAPAVLENVEFWIASNVLLRDRILPMGDRDVALFKRKVDPVVADARNKLEEKILLELMGIRDVLGGNDSRA